MSDAIDPCAKEQGELATARADLDAFVYAVSHDLRAPIRSIRGFGQILEEDFGDRLGDEGKDALDRIVAAAARLSDMVDALLSYSRVMRKPVRPEAVDLSVLAQDIREELSDSGICGKGQIEVQNGMSVRTDAELLGAGLKEIMKNGCSFGNGKPIVVGMAQDKFFVRDHGIGLRESDLERIFLPFEKLDTARPGVGMGLAIARRIFQMLGGRVWAVPNPDAGLTLYFTLPAN